MLRGFIAISLTIGVCFHAPALAREQVGICETAPAEVKESSPRSILADAHRAFAWQLYDRIDKKEQNLFLSPYSISSALTMTYAGACGATADEMASTLKLPGGDFDVHQASGQLMKLLAPDGGKDAFQLHIANALWVQKDYELLSSFLQLTKQHYDAGAHQVDFANEAEAARQTINDWIEKQTNDRIQDLLTPGSLSPMSRLVLTNAIYFKADWVNKFEKNATREGDFFKFDGSKISVPMMHQTARFAYHKVAPSRVAGVALPQFQILQMPYKGRKIVMTVLLPDATDATALNFIEKGLRHGLGKETPWLSKLETRRVRVTLPKFKMVSSLSLADVLRKMGMKLAFTPPAGSSGADFTAMAKARELFIASVVHKAFVEVNEKGTEAAAATAVTMRATAAPMDEPVEFKADRPFVFVIHDVDLKTILFVGRVTEPSMKLQG